MTVPQDMLEILLRRWAPLLLLASSSLAWAAMAPMDAPLALVAGNSQLGDADGPFLQAEFRQPMGLVLDATGKTLYVADSGNHRLRAIDLSHRVAVVRTLVGQQPGGQDGPFSRARFSLPEGLFPTARGLMVIDQQKTLRLVDLGAQTVSTVYHSPSDLLACADAGNGAWLVMTKARELLELQGVSPSSRALPYPDSPQAPSGFMVSGPDAYALTADGSLYKAPLAELLGASATAGTWARASATGLAQCELLPYSDPLSGTLALLIDHAHKDFLKVSSAYALEPLQAYGVRSAVGPLTKEERRIAGQIGGAAQDPQARCLYYSDAPSNRILRLKDYRYGALSNIEAFNSAGMREFEYPRTVPPDTTRIAFIGSSMAFKSPNEDDERSRSLPKRFETWLNLLSSLQGCPRSYEVLAFVEPASTSTTIPIRATEYAQTIKAYNATEIWLDIDYINLCDELVGWLLKGQWAGGVDPPSFLATSSAEKAKLLPPNVAHMRQELLGLEKKYRALGVYNFDAQGSLVVGYNGTWGSWYQVLDEPGLRQEMLALYRESLERMKTRLTAAWAPAPVPPITILHVPVRNVLNMAENDGGGRDPGDHVIDDFFDKELRAMAKDLGFAYVSDFDVARVLSPSYNPVFVPGDNHMARGGHDMHALAAAIQLLKRDGCPAQGSPGAP
jgi:hypothetical protein